MKQDFARRFCNTLYIEQKVTITLIKGTFNLYITIQKYIFFQAYISDNHALHFRSLTQYVFTAVRPFIYKNYTPRFLNN